MYKRLALIDVCNQVTDGSHYSPETTDKGYPYITVRDVNAFGEIDFENCKFIAEKDFQDLQKNGCQPFKGDVLFSKDGTVGKVSLVDYSKDFVVLSSLAIIRPKADVIYSPYLTYVLKDPKFLKEATGRKTGVAIRRIVLKNLKTIQIPLPSLPEQKRIVEILDEAFAGIDQAIANTEKNLASARELFESHLNTIFTQKGEGWEETTLNEIYDVRDGTHDSPKYQEEGYPLITSKNLKQDGLNFEKIKFISEEDFTHINKRSAVHKGDVLFAMIGTIGNPIVVEVEPKFAIKNVALFKVGNERSGHFLKYYLGSKFVIDKMMSEAKGTTQKFVGLGYLRSFPIFSPSPNEEQKIVVEIQKHEEQVLKLESVYEQKITALNELKQSLLQKAFSGELTVDMADEIAEAAE